ncbi:MAG TPA: DUF4129 domain-containing protein [Nitriliruptorales bacterium]|nr:DUF4129 domain-containing protein [Nitriliruptorales bacterium]
MTLPEPRIDAGHVEEVTRRVLEQPHFRRPAPSLGQRIRNEALEFLAEMLGRLLTSGASSVIAWLVVALAVAAVVALVVHHTRRITTDPTVAVPDTAPPRRSGAQWRADAERHAAAGRWRDAVRCRYRALLADLAERGLVEDTAGRTAGEYAAELGGAAPAAAGDFAAATELFEQVWYGGAPAGSAEGERLDALTGRVLAGVR